VVTQRLAWLLQRGGSRFSRSPRSSRLAQSLRPEPPAGTRHAENAGQFEAAATSEFVIDQTLARPGLLLVFEAKSGTR